MLTPDPFSGQVFTYKEVGGIPLQATVYTSAGEASRPAILWLHGGGLIFGSREMLPAYQLKTYLGAGYAVIAIDYRLAPETKLNGILEDLQDAYAWTLREGSRLFGLAVERLAVVGHSAGGYLALLSGHRLDPRPTAIVSFYGYGDITGDWYCRPDPFYCRLPPVTPEEAYRSVTRSTVASDPGERRAPFYLYCRQNGLWPVEVTGHDPEKEADWFRPYCPVLNVSRSFPPSLLIHGSEDTDVSPQQSIWMADQLSRQGVEHQLILLPGRGHTFDMAAGAKKEAGIAQLFEHVLGFLKKHC